MAAQSKAKGGTRPEFFGRTTGNPNHKEKMTGRGRNPPAEEILLRREILGRT